MHIVIFVLGALAVLAGFSAIAYGIPVNEFSFGNTLIIAGTTAVVGGLILIGLAAVVRQLMRIAERAALHEAAAPVAFDSAGPFRPQAHAMHPHAEFAGQAPKPEHGAPVPLPPEPKPAAAPSGESDPLVWLRPKGATPTFGEQTLIEEMEASLSPPSSSPAPHAPQPGSPVPREVSSAPPLKVYEQLAEPKFAPPQNPAEPALVTGLAARKDAPARSAPPVEHPPSGGMFDTVWPEIRPARTAETVARVRKPDAPAPVQQARENGKAKEEPPREAQAASEEARPAILKSGMIDGMAYTLYADGSIEAVLASGTIRFASIDALRLHLEKNA